MNKEELINFEKEIVELFNDGKLKSPVHLSGGDEDELIEIFKQIKPNDYVFSNYRSHYHALLKGINKDWLKNWILDNKSIHVMNKEHKFFTSAIVGGCLPIALGTALAIKKKQENMEKEIKEVIEPMHGEDWKVEGEVKVTPMNQPHVWCFVGDMTANTGVFWECWNYAKNFDLPITFVIADNGLSTDTNTKESWGINKVYAHWYQSPNMINKKIIYYKYKRVYPHYGTGKFIAKIWEGIDETKQKGF